MRLGRGDYEDKVGPYSDRLAQKFIHLPSSSTNEVGIRCLLNKHILTFNRVTGQKYMLDCTTISDIIRGKKRFGLILRLTEQRIENRLHG